MAWWRTQVELVLEAFGTEGGLLAELDNEARQRGGRLMRAVLGAAVQLGQRVVVGPGDGGAAICGGVAGATELAGGGLEAVGLVAGDEFWMEPVAVGFHAIEFPIVAVHPVRIAGAPRCACSSRGGAPAPPCGECSSP